MSCFHNSLFALKITPEDPWTPHFGYGLTTLKLLPPALKLMVNEREKDIHFRDCIIMSVVFAPV